MNKRSYEILAELNVRLAPSTSVWTMGGATAPIRYNAVSSVYSQINNRSTQTRTATHDGRDIVLRERQIRRDYE